MTDEGLEFIGAEGFQYEGEWEQAKGEGTSKDQMALQNKLTQQELDRQHAIQDSIKATLSKYLSGNGEGFSPEQLALLKSQFLNSNDAAFNNAGENARAAMVARGMGNGMLPVGGDFARQMGLEGMRASAQSQGLMGIDLSSLAQAINNKFNAASVMSGQGAQIGANVGLFNQGANNALNEYMKAANSGFGAMFMRALGAGLGGGVASAVTGGIGGALGTMSSFGSLPQFTGGGAIPSFGNLNLGAAPSMPLSLPGVSGSNPLAGINLNPTTTNVVPWHF